MSRNLDDLVDGLKRLKVGSLINLCLWLIFIVGSISVLYRFLPYMGLPGFVAPHPPPGTIEVFASWVTYVLYLLIVATIIFLVVTYIFWYKGAVSLARYDNSKLGIGKTGMLIVLLRTVLLLPGLFGVTYFLVRFYRSMVGLALGRERL